MYTVQSKKVLERARNEAKHLHIGSTDTGHLLLGLAQERQALVHQLLLQANCSSSQMENRVERFYRTLTRISRGSSHLYPPISRSFFLALEWAEEEAFHLGHELIGTLHLALGLLRVEDSIASRILKLMGLDVRWLARFLLEHRDELEEGTGGPSVQSTLVWHHRRQVESEAGAVEPAHPAREVRSLLLRAKERALISGEDAVNPVHLLLALLEGEGDSPFPALCEGEGFGQGDQTAKALASKVLAALPASGEGALQAGLRSGLVVLGQEVRDALAWASRAAAERGCRRFGTAGYLSALLTDPSGTAAAIFREAEIEPAAMRRLLKKAIDSLPPPMN